MVFREMSIRFYKTALLALTVEETKKNVYNFVTTVDGLATVQGHKQAQWWLQK